MRIGGVGLFYEDLLSMIGNTPIYKLNRLTQDNVYVKLEKYNPGGSIKDRAVYFMIESLEGEGLIKEGDILVEATSGNTGIALAMIGKIKGYEVVIVMPESMSIERRNIIKSYDAKLILTEGDLGMSGAIKKLEELLLQNSNYKSLNQFNNIANIYSHYKTTGPEIFEQVPYIDMFVCGVGTGGTLSGVGKYLKEENPAIKIIGVEPKSSAVLSSGIKGRHKIQGIGAGFVPENYDSSVVDVIMTISDEEAYEGVRLMSEKEGITVGISSGANIMVALKLSQMYPYLNIVTIAPDGIDKYMSEGIFDFV